jgi:coatomer subunit beta
LSKATGSDELKEDKSRTLNRVHQLTGFSDPLYAEAYVTVHHFDVMMDVFVVNQTPETLQNVTLELSTQGDLKLVERPQLRKSRSKVICHLITVHLRVFFALRQPDTIAPHANIFIKAAIKVSSTETGVVFGNLVYDVAGQSSSDKNCVVLNDIHIDIMDYISPANCSELQFKTMWNEFEWENKVVVSSNIT